MADPPFFAKSPSNLSPEPLSRRFLTNPLVDGVGFLRSAETGPFVPGWECDRSGRMPDSSNLIAGAWGPLGGNARALLGTRGRAFEPDPCSVGCPGERDPSEGRSRREHRHDPRRWAWAS
jgi:hypothetical protein